MPKNSNAPKTRESSPPSKKALIAEHRSIKALMAEAIAGETAEDVIRRKCREMVARGKRLRWTGPPFDPEILASLNGIIVEKSDDPFEGDGRIFPRHGRVVIQYRPGKPIERQRFTICHELAHTCFPDVYEFVRNHDPLINDDPAHKKFENLCDVGAGELLLPDEEFKLSLAVGSPCMPTASRIAKEYVASIEATLKRLIDSTDHPCAAVFLTDLPFKEFRTQPGKILVKWMWKSGAFRRFLKPGTLLPRALCNFDTCSFEATPFPAKSQTFWINNQPNSWYVDSLKLPVLPEIPDYPKVVVILHSRKVGLRQSFLTSPV